MKKLTLITATFLLLIGCVETNITPIPLDEDAASARKDAYTFMYKGKKPFVTPTKPANFYMWNSDSTATKVSKGIVITDGTLINGRQIEKAGYSNATWFIWIMLGYPNNGTGQPNEFLIFKDYNFPSPVYRPWVHWVTENWDIVTNPVTGDPTRSVYTSPWKLSNFPDYIPTDDYMTIQGDLIHNGIVTITFRDVQARIYEGGTNNLITPIGRASLSFTGTLDATRVNVTTLNW